MKKLSKFVALMVIVGSISGCGKEYTKMDTDVSKEEETEMSDDTTALDGQTQSESESAVLEAGNYWSEIYDVKEQGEQYEITAKLELNDRLYVTPEEFEAYEVGKTYYFGADELEMFCVDKSEEMCYFTESEGISLEEALAWGDVVSYRVDRTNPDVKKLPVYEHFGNVTGEEWVAVKTGEKVENSFVANKDCVIEYYSENYQLSQTTLDEFVNSQLQGSYPYANLWRNLYYSELELNDKGEVVRITEEMPAG